MDLRITSFSSGALTSGSQISRVVTENWALRNLFCPHCSGDCLSHFPENRPVADFYCEHCQGQYELKSINNKRGRFGRKAADGAYATMIERIQSCDNPGFFFMARREDEVVNVDYVPRFFFTPQIIEKRPPLAATARRAGWEGCSILLDLIPRTAFVPLVRNGEETPHEEVRGLVRRLEDLQENDISKRGWLLDVLACVDQLNSPVFSLQQIYRYEARLAKLHPHNNNICAKIRQQLQVLRDRGVIGFLGKGQYRKILTSLPPTR